MHHLVAESHLVQRLLVVREYMRTFAGLVTDRMAQVQGEHI